MRFFLRTKGDSTDLDFDSDEDIPGCSRASAMSFFVRNRRDPKTITIFPPEECRRISAAIAGLAEETGRFALRFDKLKDTHPYLTTKRS